MKELLRSHYHYILSEADNGKLQLSVTCGTVAVYDITIELTTQELALFHQEGETFIKRLADEISYAPDSFLHRRV